MTFHAQKQNGGTEYHFKFHFIGHETKTKESSDPQTGIGASVTDKRSLRLKKIKDDKQICCELIKIVALIWCKLQCMEICGSSQSALRVQMHASVCMCVRANISIHKLEMTKHTHTQTRVLVETCLPTTGSQEYMHEASLSNLI